MKVVTDVQATPDDIVSNLKEGSVMRIDRHSRAVVEPRILFKITLIKNKQHHSKFEVYAANYRSFDEYEKLINVVKVLKTESAIKDSETDFIAKTIR